MKSKRIAIVGSGVVGKASGKGLSKLGHDVIFSDINPVILSELAKQGYKTCEVGDLHTKNCEVFMVSVLTPTIDEHIDLRFLESALATLGKAISARNKYSLIVIRSTLPPGTISETFVPLVEKFSGKKHGIDFGLATNPEFLREISAEKDFLEPWIIVIGTENYRDEQILEEVYEHFKNKVPIVKLNIKEAEMMKYVHNIYNANKISFFNEMRSIAQQKGIDADKVFETVVQSAEASWNKQYGIRDLGPYGGSCLPKDTRAFLTWADDKLHRKMPLLYSIIKANNDLKDRKYLEEK